MKKIVSVLLAALMLMSCFGVISFAEGKVCTCPEGVHVDGQACRCCVYCPNVDDSYVLGCYDKENDGFCCSDCNGMYDAIKGCGCTCGCEYCKLGDQTGNENDSNLDDVWGPEEQEEFVDGFQAFIKKISDFFDELFDRIFEFLKLDQVIGQGDKRE